MGGIAGARDLFPTFVRRAGSSAGGRTRAGKEDHPSGVMSGPANGGLGVWRPGSRMKTRGTEEVPLPEAKVLTGRVAPEEMLHRLECDRSAALSRFSRFAVARSPKQTPDSP